MDHCFVYLEVVQNGAVRKAFDEEVVQTFPARIPADMDVQTYFANQVRYGWQASEQNAGSQWV